MRENNGSNSLKFSGCPLFQANFHHDDHDDHDDHDHDIHDHDDVSEDQHMPLLFPGDHHDHHYHGCDVFYRGDCEDSL